MIEKLLDYVPGQLLAIGTAMFLGLNSYAGVTREIGEFDPKHEGLEKKTTYSFEDTSKMLVPNVNVYRVDVPEGFQFLVDDDHVLVYGTNKVDELTVEVYSDVDEAQKAVSKSVARTTESSGLQWQIQSVPNIGNFDGDFFNPGNELSISHVVYNNTPGSDPFDALDEFTLSGGLNQGVFLVSTPANWTYSILDDTTYFSATGPSGEIQPGGNNANFAQYSSKFGYESKEANASSVASGDFPITYCLAPSLPQPAEPTEPYINGISINQGNVCFSVKDLQVPSSNNVEKATSIDGSWEYLGHFSATNTEQNVCYPMPEDNPVFFRINRVE
ncbi:hypothetical protein H6503_00295 [Candidatus Woesearchaeota archaeon]|nr:hypothetical protein [Candidatus Woesearchaeota archaeon]